MHGMDNIKKGFGAWGVLLAIHKLVVFESRMRRIMLELMTEGMGGKGCIMCSFMICTARQIVGYQCTLAKLVRTVAWLGV